MIPETPGARGPSHLDERGRVRMVDVGAKAVTRRVARASGRIEMRPETLARILEQGLDKGDLLAVARVAGIQAAKRTSELIPLCHALPLSQVSIEIEPLPDEAGLRVEASARTEARTGVEMEALTAVSVALLTLYDMAKSLERGMRITGIELLEKSGGRSGHWRSEEGG